MMMVNARFVFVGCVAAAAAVAVAVCRRQYKWTMFCVLHAAVLQLYRGLWPVLTSSWATLWIQFNV